MKGAAVHLLAGMSAKDKRALYDQLAHEMRSELPRIDFSPAELDLWECLQDALDIREKLRRPLAPFAQALGINKYREAVEYVREYVDAGCGPGVRLPVRKAMTKIVLSCLASHLIARNIPATPGVMLKSLGTLSYAVEQRYPGYASVKFLHRIVPISACA